MQKKVWYYEKWVGRHASFPPRRSVKAVLESIQIVESVRVQSSIRMSKKSPKKNQPNNHPKNHPRNCPGGPKTFAQM